MSQFTRILIAFLVTTTTALAVNTTEPSPFWSGIKAYEQGDYAAAKTNFLTALKANETAAVRHDLGLTELQLGHPTEAIWQLERALLLDPLNADYREKLNLVREQLGLPAITQKWYFSFSQIVSLNVWIIAATVSFWLLLAAWILLSPSEGKSGSRIKLLRLFILLILLLSLVAIWLNLETLKTGIVLSTENASLHAAPATAAPEIGFARPGERLRMLDQHNDFYEVKTREGSTTGWISKDNFRLLTLKK